MTISQANGDANKFKILQLLNEKTAIQRFSDGLKSGHLSTIISARAYNSLNAAIRGAKDEEVSTLSQSTMMMMEQSRFFSNRPPRRGTGRDNYHYRGNQKHTCYQRGHPTQRYAQVTYNRGSTPHVEDTRTRVEVRTITADTIIKTNVLSITLIRAF